MKTYLKKFKYQIKHHLKTGKISFLFPLSEVKINNDLSREVDTSMDIVSETEDELSSTATVVQKSE